MTPALATSFSLLTTITLNWHNHNQVKVKAKVMLRLMVSRTVCQAHIWCPRPHFYYFRQLRVCWWREDGSAVYNYCWSSPAQSFSGPSSVGLVTIFYCLRFETSFSSPPRTRRATVGVLDPASLLLLSCRTILITTLLGSCTENTCHVIATSRTGRCLTVSART
jgi:hypothetical protein